MVKRPTGSDGEPSSPNCGASAGVKARQLFFLMQGGEPQQIIHRMRINLATPFAEKDAVKALGARGDATKKLWCTVDAADLTLFLRWIPSTKVPKVKVDALTMPRAKSVSAPAQKFNASTATKSVNEILHCGCQVLPWQYCVHTTSP
jgi:hypothetical protein